jgi:hypothetical protein
MSPTTIHAQQLVAEMVATTQQAFRLDHSPEDEVRRSVAPARRDGLVA